MIDESPDLQNARRRADAYLKAKVVSGEYGLSCIAAKTEDPWPHNKGHLLAGFLVSEARGDRLSDSERSLLAERVRVESRDGLWSYAPDAHPGAISSDDSAFALRLCGNLGLDVSCARLLEFYREPRTGVRAFTTFLNLIGSEPHLAFEQSLDDHRQFHPEVNANVFLLLKQAALAKYIDYELITMSQAPEGYWYSYCYPGHYYATYLFLDFIRDNPELSGVRERGLSFLLDSQNDNGSWGTPGEPYETALAVNALAVCGAFSGAFERGVAFLLESQEKDGSWASPKVIWEYLERADDLWQAFDSNRVVTTALGLHALARVTNR